MKRHAIQYVGLLALLAITIVYQVRSLEFHFPEWFPHAEAIYPVLALTPGPRGLTVAWEHSSAAKAGIHDGDILIAANGRSVSGKVAFAHMLEQAHTGEKLRFTMLSPESDGRLSRRTVIYKLDRYRPQVSVLDIFFDVIMPAFCLLLGFWVAAVRPGDGLAWLLLADLLSLATISEPSAEFWGRWLRDFGTVYYQVFCTTWPIWTLLLGIYFPERFPAQRRRRWLSSLKWALIILLGLFVAIGIVAAVGALRNYNSVIPLVRFFAPAQALNVALIYIAVSAFFACTCAKWRMATSRDSRRRLRLLYFGATISFTPLAVLMAISFFHHVPLENYFPSWLFTLAYTMFFLFPLTLAYVIVVHKAMDVRVVIRQGLQYALAKNGIVVLRVIIVGLLILFMILVNVHLKQRRILPLVVIAAGSALIIAIGRLLKRLRAWTDKRFFRDAYNAEIVLSDLGEKVRTIVEPRPLLDTVCKTISDTLHVPNIAVLLRQSAEYKPAYALGYAGNPKIVFPERAATVQQLSESREPARVYLDDRNSWVYRTAGLTEEERKKLAALRAQLLLPLTVKDHLLGFISLGEKRSEEPYTGSDLRLLKSVAAQTGLALENAQLSAAMAQEVAQREKLSRELEIAREVQERLFPQKLPSVAGLDYCGTCRTALGVGGDYFDFLALAGGRLGLAVGDVSGKGIAAALMMASLQASLRSEAARAENDLSGLVSNVNHRVYEASASNRYATFFYAQYDPSSCVLTYVNAGHNPPVIFKPGADGPVVRLEPGGTVIGLLEHACYAQDEVRLDAGDVLVAYTDGITEAMNREDEEWGEERFMAALKAAVGLPAAQIAARIMDAATRFAAGAPQHDDMTLVVLRVVEQ
jgi:sigma-B regulation protein RsbU (phosphoserine phosphatase)